MPFRMLYDRTHQLFLFLFAAPLVNSADLSVHVAFDHKVILAAIEPEYLLRDFNDDDKVVQPGYIFSRSSWSGIAFMETVRRL